MRLKILILLLLSALMVVGATVGITKTKHMMSQMPEIISSELSKSMGTQVSVQGIEVESLTTVSVKGIRVYDKQQQLLGSCAKATVHMNPVSLLSGKAPVEAVSEIALDGLALVLTERQPGIWNIQDLIKEHTSGEAAFQGKVRLNDAEIVLTMSKGAWELTSIDGQINLANNKAAVVSLEGDYNGSKVRVSGQVGQQLCSLQIKAADVDLAAFQGFLPANEQVLFKAGRAKDIVIHTKQDQSGLIFAGEGRVYDLVASALGYTVEQGQALLTFTNQNLYLYQAQAEVNGQEVHAAGKVSLNLSKPVFSVNVSSTGLNPAAFQADLPFTGQLAFNAQVFGTVDDLRINGMIKANNGQVDQYVFSKAEVNFSYKDRMLMINRYAADLYGGYINGSGIVNIDNLQYSFNVIGKGIDTEAIRLVEGLKTKANFEVALSGQGRELPAVIGKAELEPGQYKNIDFTSIKCSFVHKDQDTNFEYINVLLPEGYATLSGHIASGNLQGTLQGHQLPLSLLGKQFNLSAAGNVELSGSFEGTLDDPQFIAVFMGNKGEIYSQPFTRLEGAVTLNKESLNIQNVMLINGNGEHRIRGTVGLSGDKPLRLAVSTRQIRAEHLVSVLLPSERLTGNLNNELFITGTVANPEAEGRFVLTDGSFRGQLIHKLEGYYKYQQDRVELTGIDADMIAGHASLAGTIDRQGNLNLKVDADRVDLTRLGVEYPYPIEGLAAFKGTISGTTSLPVFMGEATSGDIAVNQEHVKNILVGLTAAGSQVTIGYAQFSVAQGKYEFHGSSDFQSHKIQGVLTVEHGEIKNLLALINQHTDITGDLNGTINLGGTWENPDVNLVGHFTQGKIKKYPLTSMDVDLALSNHVVTINQFVAKQGKGILAAQGTADLKGSIDIEMGARDLDAGLLTALTDVDVQSDGKLNINAQISGMAANPRAAISLEVKDGVIAGSKFDNLYGLFIVEQGSININQLYIAKGEYKASAYGVIPLKALNSKGLKQATAADQMDIKVLLDRADLSILPDISKQVSWAFGSTKGQVHIGGTLAQPSVDGQITINDGVIKFVSLSYPLQKVGVDIRFEGDKIVLNTFEGRMGLGSFHLSGATKIRGLEFNNYNLELALDRLGIQHEYFKGPITGNLMLTQTAGKPKLSGKLLFEEDTINIPVIPKLGRGDAGSEILLDLDVSTGKKVRFYNSYFYDFLLTGSAHFAGSTRFPDASGKFEVTRGTVSYLRTPFKIDNASAEFTQYRSFEPVIKLNAHTKLQETSVNLNISGPASAMEMKLTSEPSMSQQEIMSLLTLRSRYFDKTKSGDNGLGRDELVSLLDVGLQMRFMSEMESILRDALGVDEFKVIRGTVTEHAEDKTQPGSGGKTIDTHEEIYQAEFSKYITDKLMLNYTMGIDKSTHSWGFQYDLTRQLSVAGSVDEQNHRKIGLEMKLYF